MNNKKDFSNSKKSHNRDDYRPERKHKTPYQKPDERLNTEKKQPPPQTPTPISENTADEMLRLNKYLAAAGVCSRREADQYIKNGQVKVNGTVVTEMGVMVKRTDNVEFKGKKLIPETKVYVLLNKPKNTITTVDDPDERRTVMDLIDGCCQERLYPVGRLDRNTTGVLLLTNDGQLAKKLTHPSSQIKKVYYATLDKPVTKDDIVKMAEGVELEDGFIAPDVINFADNDRSQIGIEIHSGRNRIIRRFFEHFGYTVEKLDRIFFAGLSKKDVPRGKYRFLNQKEIGFLKML